MGFKRYIVQRLVSVVPTLLVLSLIIYYTTTFFPPEQRVMLFISPFRMAGSRAPDPIPRLIQMYHLNDPFYVQYATWLQELLRGNLGYSHSYGMPVATAILQFLPATLELVLFSAPIILIGGYKLGVLSAKRAQSKAPKEDMVDFTVRTVTTVGYSIPTFVLGLLLLIIFFFFLGWVSPGRLSINFETDVFSSANWVHYTGLLTIDGLLNGRPDVTWDALKHLVLPVVTLVTQNLAIVARITRSSMLGELHKPYIVAAKARGLDEKGVVKHASKNSLTAVLTVSGLLFASLLTGVVVTEYIFNIHGLGYLVMRAAFRFDFALLVGVSLFFCVVFMLINVIVDIAYARIDPRIKL